MYSVTTSRRPLALTTGLALLTGVAAALPAAAAVRITHPAPPAPAAKNLLVNGDFESLVTAGYTSAPTAVPGFTSGGDKNSYGVCRLDVNGGSLYGAADPDGGTQFGYVGNATTLTQTLDGTGGTNAARLQAGTVYTLSGDIGYRADQPAGGFAFDALTFSLMAGGRALASRTFAPDPTGHYGTFVPFSFTYDSTAAAPVLLGQTLSVEVAGSPTDRSVYNQGNFDGLRLTAAPAPPAVPEASTTVSLGLMLALGLGGAALAAKEEEAGVGKGERPRVLFGRRGIIRTVPFVRSTFLEDTPYGNCDTHSVARRWPFGGRQAPAAGGGQTGDPERAAAAASL